MPFVSMDEVLAQPGCCIVDLRSPGEFAIDHLPGAHSVPLFDDAERALVGTLYNRHSGEEAFARGILIVVQNISALVQRIAQVSGRDARASDLEARVRAMAQGGLAGMQRELQPVSVAQISESTLVLHCWRGGMRSSSVLALLRALGWTNIVALEGGYKSYRTRVLKGLSAWSPPRSFVLRGGTGVGKTLVLREIERLRPGLTVDLELAAGHRSSILGMVGLKPRSQKSFDSELFCRLRQPFGPCVVFEGESRKVGDVIIPAALWSTLKAGTNIYIEASDEYRVEVLMADYLNDDASRAELRRQLPFIEERLGPRKWSGELVRLLDEKREPELVKILLRDYYDPLYRHSETGRSYALRLTTTDPITTAQDIIVWLESQTIEPGSIV